MPTRTKPPAPVRLRQLTDRLHRQGLPLTIQRRAIFEVLIGHPDHPTADQVYELVRARIPGLSRTTVYRVLETFVRLGMARKLEHPRASTRFDPRVDPHHHILCQQCGAVADLDVPRDERLTIPSLRRTGFKVTGYSIHFTGTCAACLGQSSTRNPDQDS